MDQCRERSPDHAEFVCYRTQAVVDIIVSNRECALIKFSNRFEARSGNEHASTGHCGQCLSNLQACHWPGIVFGSPDEPVRGQSFAETNDCARMLNSAVRIQ